MAEMPTCFLSVTLLLMGITQPDQFRVHLHQSLRCFTESQNSDSSFPLILPSPSNKVSIHLPNFCPSCCDEHLYGLVSRKPAAKQ